VQTTNSPSHLPAIGQNIADQATRDGVAEAVADPAVPQSLDVDRSRSDDDAHLLRDVERASLQAAQPHDATTLALLRTVPGIGQSLSRVLLDDIHDLDRCPRGQEFAAEGRLVTCAQESAGQRSGTSGPHSGHAPLTWAFADAAVFVRREHPAGQTCRVSGEHTHGQGQAWTSLAHHWARAVSDL
jgi:hypothetical protein